MQFTVPAPQTPRSPVVQGPPPPGLPSSMTPLQLSSMPLQTSTWGGSGLHTLGTPFLQEYTVLRHAPMPQVMLPSPSSTLPLQSLSLPSQTSGVGWPGTHVWTTPPTQFCTWAWQAPTPQTEVPRPSSVVPLQSSSLALQTSGDGSTSPWHASHWPPWHTCVPAAQTPTPSVAGGPV